jgi:hypothetical protein
VAPGRGRMVPCGKQEAIPCTSQTSPQSAAHRSLVTWDAALAPQQSRRPIGTTQGSGGGHGTGGNQGMGGQGGQEGLPQGGDVSGKLQRLRTQREAPI